MKTKWKSLAIAFGLSSVFIADLAIAATKTFSNYTYRGLPIDATPVEWNGINEQEGFEDASNLFCEWQGYEYAISWSVGKNEPIADRGNYRFSLNNPGEPQYCESCRWHLALVRCFRRSS